MPEARVVVEVVNDAGLHARPCHAIVQLALAYEASLRVTCSDMAVSGKSILELMTLAAGRGDRLELTADGPDAEELLEALARLVAGGFCE